VPAEALCEGWEWMYRRTANFYFKINDNNGTANAKNSNSSMYFTARF